MTAESDVLYFCRLPDARQDLGFVFKAKSEIPGQARYDGRRAVFVFVLSLPLPAGFILNEGL